MYISLAGVVGGVFGLLVGLIDYALIAGLLEKRLRASANAGDPADRAALERNIRVMRIAVLVISLATLGGLGYWMGVTVGG